MPRSRTAMRRLTRIAVTTSCAAALAVTQAAQAHAASRTVNFNYSHLWQTPEFKTGGGAVHFTVKKCNDPHRDMTVLLRATDGINIDVGTRTIKCRAGAKAVIGDGLKGGTFELELGKLDDNTYFKGTATYSFTAPK
ncbi:hypothetical protein OIE62_00495 [Streptomyces scopuliridis]|uniref:Uncharacterized protein n=2 Tax=Streptomyces scopuliridis TaxID=452529 RepID=A0ACD4ZWX2_9ACTN|nr:hypothetical protein [Streptomyces scopuliridis]WSC02793.1 hypothetical protein OG835_41335 [Streptomyces scopuliridis]WSC03673.1 hypothetical protein OIE62_00495 [Streptomyces scopuliridis]